LRPEEKTYRHPRHRPMTAMERKALRPKLAGQRPSTLNASGSIRRRSQIDPQQPWVFSKADESVHRRAQHNPRAIRNDSSLYQLSLHPQRLWDRETQRLSGFDVDDEIDPSRLLNRKIARFCTLEDLIHVRGGAMEGCR
jgi:hypothetical protein